LFNELLKDKWLEANNLTIQNIPKKVYDEDNSLYKNQRSNNNKNYAKIMKKCKYL